jgi:hypothetical protein
MELHTFCGDDAKHLRYSAGYVPVLGFLLMAIPFVLMTLLFSKTTPTAQKPISTATLPKKIVLADYH